VKKNGLQGRLRVDLPVGVAKNILIAALPEFLQQHPAIELELSCTDRRVDVIREGFDCVMRIGALNDSSLIARPLGFLRQINLASPAYLARYGTPRTLEDLREHFLVHYASNFGSKVQGFEYQQQGKPQFLKMKGKLTVNNSDAYQAACLAGFGIIQAPHLGAQTCIEQGKLVEILPQFRALSMPVSLLYPDRRHLAKRTQQLMEWMALTLAPHLQRFAD